jgi:hypothetical protein
MAFFGRKKVDKEPTDNRMPFLDIEKIQPSQPSARSPQFPPQQQRQPERRQSEQFRYNSSYGPPAPVNPSVPVHERMPAPAQPVHEPKREEERVAFAPLFVKITRYKQILNSLNYLKMSVNLIRNQLAILNELDRLRSENMQVLESTIEKVSNVLVKLDAEFMRPSGFMEDMPEMAMDEVGSLEDTLTDLRAQIEGLKEEVESA